MNKTDKELDFVQFSKNVSGIGGQRYSLWNKEHFPGQMFINRSYSVVTHVYQGQERQYAVNAVVECWGLYTPPPEPIEDVTAE